MFDKFYSVINKKKQRLSMDACEIFLVALVSILPHLFYSKSKALEKSIYGQNSEQPVIIPLKLYTCEDTGRGVHGSV